MTNTSIQEVWTVYWINGSSETLYGKTICTALDNHKITYEDSNGGRNIVYWHEGEELLFKWNNDENKLCWEVLHHDSFIKQISQLSTQLINNNNELKRWKEFVVDFINDTKALRELQEARVIDKEVMDKKKVAETGLDNTINAFLKQLNDG